MDRGSPDEKRTTGAATPGVGLGVLSWRAPQTLARSLESYAREGFLDAFEQRVIYFSDISDQDRELARRYGFEFAGGPNGGIGVGMQLLAESMRSEYVLLLQNDNPLVEPPGFAIEHIREAVPLIAEGRADLVRMRHRWRVGEWFPGVRKYLRFHPVASLASDFLPDEHPVREGDYGDSLAKRARRLMFRAKAKSLSGHALYVEDRPDEVLPNKVVRDGNFFVVDSEILEFTDQCLLLRRSFFLDVLMAEVRNHPKYRRPGGYWAPETCINGRFWKTGGFRIGQGRVLFTHKRLDGSFRSLHPAYDPESLAPDDS
jgi:hypothetical protein